MIRNKIVKDDIIVRKSILHILNSGSGQIGLATNLIDMGPDLFDMIRDKDVYKRQVLTFTTQEQMERNIVQS